MSQLDIALDHVSTLRKQNCRLAIALGDESVKLTRLMDDSNALLHILTSDAAADLPPILKMGVNAFMRLHPEVVPK